MSSQKSMQISLNALSLTHNTGWAALALRQGFSYAVTPPPHRGYFHRWRTKNPDAQSSARHVILLPRLFSSRDVKDVELVAFNDAATAQTFFETLTPEDRDAAGGVKLLSLNL